MLPEEKLAQKVLSQFPSTLPVDVLSILKKYAIVTHRHIPIEGVDGVSLDIKISGKTPRVIINNSTPLVRQRFTIAHELGHLRIPWHLGKVIVDHVDNRSADFFFDWEYQKMEGEANRFAAELLMPRAWIFNKYEKSLDLAEFHKELFETAEVSSISAAIRLVQILDDEIYFCIVNELGYITSCGKSEKSYVMPLKVGERLSLDAFSGYSEHYVSNLATQTFHWWRFKPEVVYPKPEDNRTWREVLDGIVSDISVDDPIRLKRSINGVVSNVNGSRKNKSEPWAPKALFSASLQRMDRPEFLEFNKHKDFELFLWKRVEEFCLSPKK